MHCAASIAFDLPLDEARAINVEGTREVIGFAREARRSGAWSASCTSRRRTCPASHEGTFRERQLDAGQEFRNTYEQTKWEAEHVVATADDLAPAIARPSIVMGESDTGWTPAFNVFYWPLRAFSRGLFDEIPALPTAHVDVVPGRLRGRRAGAPARARRAGVFNLSRAATRRSATSSSSSPATASTGRARRSCRGAPAPARRTTTTGAVYLPYFDMDMVFDDSRARGVLGPAGIRPPKLADYFAQLIDYAELVRWGKRSMTREEARERLRRRGRGGLKFTAA